VSFPGVDVLKPQGFKEQSDVRFLPPERWSLLQKLVRGENPTAGAKKIRLKIALFFVYIL